MTGRWPRNILERWQLDDSEMTVRWQWDYFVMSERVLLDDWLRLQNVYLNWLLFILWLLDESDRDNCKMTVRWL